MTGTSANAKARRLRALHDGPILVLPNVWDAASAAIVASAGASAVATTSGGVAWSLGYADGERTPLPELVQAVRRIAAAVDVPVTVDIEAGYEEVAETVRMILDAGAVGFNIEDSRAVDGTLHSATAQAERIRAARDGSVAAGVPDAVINVRTDVFLFEVGAPSGRVDDVLARAQEYAKAGADCLFVPGLVDLDLLAGLTASVPLPVNVMAGPGSATVAEFAAAGVRRVSVGTAMAQAVYELTRRAAHELFADGTYGSLDQTMGYPELNALFPR